MKPVHLLTAVLAQPLDILELYQLAINNRVASLASDEESLAVGKSNADVVAGAFSEEIEHMLPQGQVVKQQVATKYDAEIVSFVKANPGCSTRDIQTAVGVKYNSHWSLIKNRIVAQGLHSTGITKGLRWFPGRVDEKPVEIAPEPIQAPTSIEQLVLNYIQSHPGCQRPDILKDLNMTLGVWNRVNVRLRQEGSIVLKGERKGSRWYVSQPKQIVLPFKKKAA